MAKFKVTVVRSVYGSVSNDFEIEADSQDEAENQAKNADWNFSDGEFYLDGEDIVDVTSEELDEDNK